MAVIISILIVHESQLSADKIKNGQQCGHNIMWCHIFLAIKKNSNSELTKWEVLTSDQSLHLVALGWCFDHTRLQWDIFVQDLKFIICGCDTWSAEMIHSRKKNSLLFWQQRCDWCGETRKTKWFYVFEEWLTTEDQSSWQRVFLSFLTFCLRADSLFLTSSTSFYDVSLSGNERFPLLWAAFQVIKHFGVYHSSL